MSSHYVYVIVNKINLKLYFGSHSWDGEGLDPNYYGSGQIIKQAVNKYGKDNFIVYPIKFYDNADECRKAEEELLKKYDIANNQYCYNIKNGAIGWTSEDMKGEKNPNYGKHHTEETRKKLSQANKGENNPMYGKTHTENTRKKMSQANKGEKHPMYGKHHTDATRKKMSQASKGENNPMYGKRGKDSQRYGKHHTDETRQKLSESKKGEKHPNYGKRGKGTPFYGKHHTEETRQKMSEAQKGENNPMYGKRGKDSPRYGKHHTEDAKRKMSESKKGENNPNYGKHPTHTEETRKKLSEANNYRKTPIVAIDKNGKVKIFESKRECARQLNLNRGNIYNCLRGRCKTCKGYTFKYVEELESGIYEGFTGIAE